MANFKRQILTDSDFIYRYTESRFRDAEAPIFFNTVPEGYVYDPTWPDAIKNNAQFEDIKFLSIIACPKIHIDFIEPLTSQQESSLAFLYDNHIAPELIV